MHSTSEVKVDAETFGHGLLGVLGNSKPGTVSNPRVSRYDRDAITMGHYG